MEHTNGSDVSQNIIEDADMNYMQELFKLPPSRIATIHPADHVEMRKWLTEEYITWPKTPPVEARSRAISKIHIQTVPVTYEDGNQFAVRVYDPEIKDSSPRPALIMYHGGGWVHGFPEVDEGTAEFFASELRAVVINVDYRLAPENKFPIPLNDCYQAVQWAIDNAAKYNINPDRIGLWGCSAGGNLAAAVALRDAKEHTVPRIRHVNLVVPVTCHPDLYPEVLKASRSSGRIDKDVVGQLAVLRAVWDNYAGVEFAHGYASVLKTEVPTNHPPCHITVAGRDGLRDEGIAYALHLRNAGIDTQLEIVPGVPHGITFPTTTLAARQFFRNQVRALDYALKTI
ncbi:alpha/beta hydrolase fold domain-containing protein [Trichoderma breve]|uniref:Alpha/beta hydrolase fold domain-containing protein n=1 Tax=Trichoderma breve TaxID=2034170 RepID=A0A9W9E925_9HYPO|nr:alpha/beta hydrolase fold domain-containing protein [Trichoderma breve]KAJ4862654.1 alpha/beta hydrolase fold domain-containing protein [Trichoderma breve]